MDRARWAGRDTLKVHALTGNPGPVRVGFTLLDNDARNRSRCRGMQRDIQEPRLPLCARKVICPVRSTCDDSFCHGGEDGEMLAKAGYLKEPGDDGLGIGQDKRHTVCCGSPPGGQQNSQACAVEKRHV
jgi:hypothetical protein